MRAPLRGLGAALLALMLISPAALANPALTWTIERATIPDGSRDDPSLAYDPTGIPYIAYFEDVGNDLVLTWKQNSAWLSDTVSLIDGRSPSLAFNSQSNPVIAYHQRLVDLRYTFFVGTGWIDEVVEAGDAGDLLSMDIGPFDEPHIAYRNNDSLSLAYARRGPGGWAVEHIVTGTGGMRGLSMAVDSNGDPHIVYVQNTPLQMRYATKSGGVWSFETIDSTGTPTVWPTAIKVDADDRPYVAYSEGGTGDLAYATRTTGSWFTDIADGAPETVGQSASLVLDETAIAHIAHLNFNDSSVLYTTNSGGSWASCVAVLPDSVSKDLQIAMDPAGNIGIVGVSGTGDDIIYYTTGAFVLDAPLSAPANSRLRVSPTPARAGRASIHFTLSVPGDARITIHDAMGRRVRALRDGRLPAGAVTAQWDGRTDLGTSVEPGVYFARLEVDGRPLGEARFVVIR